MTEAGETAATVTVSPVARALFRDVAERRRRAAGPSDPGLEPALPSPPAAAPASPDLAAWRADAANEAAQGDDGGRGGPPPRGSAAADLAPMAPTRLRRDGMRPLRFMGAPLLERSARGSGSGMTFSLSLHLVEDGRVAAALSVSPAAEIEAGEVHRAELLEEPDALRALLDGFEPERALPDPSLVGPEAGDRVLEMRRAIRADFERLTASLRRVAPHEERRVGR